MSFWAVLRRMGREWRLLGVLLVSVILLTGFFALGPLYARAVAEVAARYATRASREQQLNIAFVNPSPMAPESWERVIKPYLGEYVVGEMRFASTAGPQDTQSMICGYEYRAGASVSAAKRINLEGHCYQVFGYARPQEIFSLAAGRWPVPRDPPEPSFFQQPQVMGEPQVEAVITTSVSAGSGVQIGDRLVVGSEPERTVTIEIVGLIDPALAPQDTFWSGHHIVLSGVNTPIGTELRYDFGPVVLEEAYDEWIAPVAESNTYYWWLRTDPNRIGADALDTLESKLRRAQGEMQLQYARIDLLSGLTDIIAGFRAGIAEVEGPVVFLSGAVLILMLYNLATAVSLVLEQHSYEWAMMTSRGASAWQLVKMQLATMTILGSIGFVLGPLVAWGFLQILARIGPLAVFADGAATITRVSFPSETILLSLVAAVVSVLVLTLPAWVAARRSILQLQRQLSRPPQQPVWARYYLDAILLLVGGALLVRLYFLIGGDVRANLELLVKNPAELVRLVSAGNSLKDPFSLIGPALLLTGAALLWLRLFPVLMRIAGRLLQRGRGLTVPLALWGVARDPGHYAQLVLLLIGALALGVASLVIQATHDASAWELARHEVGADARVAFDPGEAGRQPDWLALPGVAGGASVMRLAGDSQDSAKQMTLFGLDPASFSTAFPEHDAVVALLNDAEVPPLGGIALPADATTLTIQVFTEANDEAPTETRLALILLDTLGVPLVAPLTTTNPSNEGSFAPYTATIADIPGNPPYRLAGLQLLSQREGFAAYERTIHIDSVTATNSRGEETTIEDFEAELLPAWQLTVNASQGVSAFRSEAQAFTGKASLTLRCRVTLSNPEPQMAINRTGLARVPVVVSEAFAIEMGRRIGRPPLKAGASGVINVNLPLGRVALPYFVIGVARDFPTVGAQDHFIIAPIGALRPAVNSTASADAFYDQNQAWLSLATREPRADFQAAVMASPGILGGTYAWDRYNAILREPLPNAVTGMLIAGFWVALGLAVLDFAFYLTVTARRRAVSFAVLQAIGWEARNIWGLLAVEQAVLITPAMLVGLALGALLAYLLFPFLTLVDNGAFSFPLEAVAGLLLVVAVAFVLLLTATSAVVRRMIGPAQTLRFYEQQL